MTGMGQPLSGPRNADQPRDDLDAPVSADHELLARLRSGEDAAFGEVFARHADAVRRLALRLSGDRAEAEDLTAEAFFRVLQAIRRGYGPVDNVRAYLLIATRRVAMEWSTRRRDVPVTDDELNHRAGHDHDASGLSYERSLIARAFSSLPERWRRVLWKTEVEGERPAVVASNLGLSPNATSALARRARQGLRAAYLQAHLAAERGATGCRSVLDKLGAYTAGSVRGAERRRIRAHLADCASCRATHAELSDVCSGLCGHVGSLMTSASLGALVDRFLVPQAAGGTVAASVKVAVAATSVAAVGALGVLGPLIADSSALADRTDDGRAGVRLMITGPTTGTTAHTPIPRTGSLRSFFEGPDAFAGQAGSPHRTPPGGAAPAPQRGEAAWPDDRVPTGSLTSSSAGTTEPETPMDTSEPTSPSVTAPPPPCVTHPVPTPSPSPPSLPPPAASVVPSRDTPVPLGPCSGR